MGETVALPAWLLAIVLALAAWTLYERLLVPVMRWIAPHQYPSMKAKRPSW